MSDDIIEQVELLNSDCPSGYSVYSDAYVEALKKKIMKIKMINHKLKVSPEYELETDYGFKCEKCGVTINHFTDLCNKCYGATN